MKFAWQANILSLDLTDEVIPWEISYLSGHYVKSHRFSPLTLTCNKDKRGEPRYDIKPYYGNNQNKSLDKNKC